MSSQIDDLCDQLFPEQSEAEQLMALATAMSCERRFENGRFVLYFQLEGSVATGAATFKGKAFKRLIHFTALLSKAEDQITAQGQARAKASKSRRPRTSGRKTGKGGAK